MNLQILKTFSQKILEPLLQKQILLTVNSRIKQRSSGKCITSDKSYRFLVEDKEQKQR
jgi:hypothetical protein